MLCLRQHLRRKVPRACSGALLGTRLVNAVIGSCGRSCLGRYHCSANAVYGQRPDRSAGICARVCFFLHAE